jgi:hypothetical protein
MLALALATLMAILAIGGIRAIARVYEIEQEAPAAQVQSADAESSIPLNEWTTPAESAASTGAAPTDSPSAEPSQESSQKDAASTSKSTTSPSSPAASPVASPAPSSPSLAVSAVSNYTPRQEAAPADTTNYGDRYATDIYGNSLNNDWLIVLHETVGTADGAIRTFQTPHPNDDDQVSYHTLIRLDGTIVYIVPPEKRAYGAGNSAFRTATGIETVRTDPRFPPSVNNFAYHISLETPPDGHHDNPIHSGYTREQYQSLAWLISKTPVPDDRITTHQAVDQSGSRMDPRSFNAQQFFTVLHAFPERNVNRASE